jgi:MazG family protein
MKTVTRLIEMMNRLRDPAHGCPWDREQDFSSILVFTLEEVYELAEAIDRRDFAALRDELGDLLLHLVFYARMAEEQGQFDFTDVVAGIVEKLERRHPHVFGDEPSLPAADQNRLWEQRKVEERRRAGGAGSGFLAGVPEALPALSRALKLQKRAAAAGFDWRTLPPVLAKLDEEIAELRQVLAEADADAARVEEEVGDLLFSTVNAARHAGVDPETALRRANRKFAVRFGMVEAELAARGKRPEQATLEEMDSIWQSLKS